MFSQKNALKLSFLVYVPNFRKKTFFDICNCSVLYSILVYFEKMWKKFQKFPLHGLQDISI